MTPLTTKSGGMWDFQRWQTSPSFPWLGWAYSAAQVEGLAVTADAFARNGDPSLYQYTTTTGAFNSAGNDTITGGPKSILNTMIWHNKYYDGGIVRTVGGGVPLTPPADSCHNLTYAPMANRWYNNTYLKNGYMRTGAGMPGYPVNCSGNSIFWGGTWGFLPGMLFMFGQMENQLSPYPGSSPTPTPTPTPTPSPTPSGTQLVSGTTMTANSQNFDVNEPITHLWDACTTPTDPCKTASPASSSFWVEFDFGQPYNLSTARLFGDADGGWLSNSWTVQYKLNQTDAWTNAFSNVNALTNNWVTQPLTNVTGRYVRVTVNGNTAANGTEARELEIYGIPAQATPTPTPTPTLGPVACSQYTPSTTIPTGFASPYDVVSAPNTNLMNATCLNLTDARLDLGKGDPLQYIYNTGYLFKTGGTNWTPISYTSTEQLIANAWYPKSATTNITMTQTELANPSYNLAYICSWTGSSWKCGCRDQACTQSYWQIQSFKR